MGMKGGEFLTTDYTDVADGNKGEGVLDRNEGGEFSTADDADSPEKIFAMPLSHPCHPCNPRLKNFGCGGAAKRNPR
jgi:hypothetical protein